jgi:hypothetical protein
VAGAAAILLAGSAVLAPVDRAVAAASDPAPLWQAFPLDDASAGSTPASGATTPARDRSPRRRSPEASSSITPGQLGGGGVPWLVLVLGAAATAVFVAVALDLRRGALSARRRRAYPDRPATSVRPRRRAALRPRARLTAPAPAGPPPVVSPPPEAARPPTAAPPSDPGADGAPARRPRARGPVCQVRWLPRGRGMCFSAVITAEDGSERTLATSPPVQWRRSGPPDETSEARAALRQLSKTVRESGWRAMRAKGKDYDEQRWYARRFRPITEPSEGTDAATGDAGPRGSGRGTAA